MDLAPIGVLCILGIQYIDGYIIKFMECMNLKRCFKNHRSFQFLSLKNNWTLRVHSLAMTTIQLFMKINSLKYIYIFFKDGDQSIVWKIWQTKKNMIYNSITFFLTNNS